jgi:hypothetical protein
MDYSLRYQKSSEDIRALIPNARCLPREAMIMTSEQLTAIAGALLSLAFSYVPGLRSRYEPLSETTKRLVMLALLITAAASVYGLACTEWGVLMQIGITCDKPGLLRLVWSLILAIIANQATFLIHPKWREKETKNIG